MSGKHEAQRGRAVKSYRRPSGELSSVGARNLPHAQYDARNLGAVASAVWYTSPQPPWSSEQMM
jgi:hypothetical protein